MSITTNRTGDTSVAALLEDGPLEALDFRARLSLWNTGNIDAPDTIPVGGVRAVFIRGELEGFVAAAQERP